MDKEILEAKKKLYLLLLKKENNVTDNELDIMSLLSKDKQVQEFLQTKVNSDEKK